MKQIFLASSFFELVCLAAGIDSGVYDTTAAPALLGTDGVESSDELTGGSTDGGRAGDSSGAGDGSGNGSGSRERILLLSNNAAVLELTRPFATTPGADRLLARFDRVLDLNASVHPAHPSSWSPAHNDLPMVEAHLREKWGLGDDSIELVLESPQVNPAIALGRVFSRATIRVHADGLMSYGPTRNQIPLANGQRMSTLHYLPLVPGLEPRLLAEFGIVPVPLAPEAFRAVVREVGEATASELDEALDNDLPDSPWAFAVGQYLAALGLITGEEETALHVEMINEAAARGFSRVVFKPHPAAPPAQFEPLFDAAEKAGVELSILDIPILAEVVIDRLRPGLIVGGFSTALATAREIYEVPALTVGADMLLEAITPYQNSNRIPLTIIAEVCDGSAPVSHSSAEELSSLVAAVSYCMAPDVSRDLRGSAEAFLEQVFGGDDAAAAAGRFRRYFKRKRLTSLRLPGGNVDRFAPRQLVRRTGTLAVLAARRQQKRLATRSKSRRQH